MKVVLVSFLMLMTSCSYTISMANTSGPAEDVIDETSTHTPNISPNVELPFVTEI